MADAPRCEVPAGGACEWRDLCLPGRCIREESEGSPNYERFAPREESGGNLWRERMLAWLDKGAAFCCGVGCVGIALYLAIWWGWLR